MNKQSFRTNILTCIMLISVALTILTAFSDVIINKFIEMRYDIVVDSSKAQSIGIIGGADGPTAIFLSGSQGSNQKYMWMLVFLTISMGCYFLKRRMRSQ